MNTDKPEIKVAILDLYDGVANEGMRGFREILERYRTQHELNLIYQVFDVRGKAEVPDLHFDAYISSGGPGSPLDSEGSVWERNYFNLIDNIEDHNLGNGSDKKHVFFVCHSFQLMCRKYRLGEISTRRSPSFGVLPVHLVGKGNNEQVFQELCNPFYTVDSRSWQVINPDEKRLNDLGMDLVALEKERSYVDLPRAMMAIRFSPYFFATQFHPEADAHGMSVMLQREDKKADVIGEHGEAKYIEMLERLEDPDKIVHTQRTIIPNFLDEAVLSLEAGKQFNH